MPNEISVSNLDVISFLLVRGYTVDRTEQSGRIVYFIFSDPQNSAKLTISEYHRDYKVSAKALFAALKQAKDEIFQTKRELSNGEHENDPAYKPAGK